MDVSTSSLSKQEHNSRSEKVVTSEIEIGLPFTVPHQVYKFQMIC
jgi:hypothetical protein